MTSNENKDLMISGAPRRVTGTVAEPNSALQYIRQFLDQWECEKCTMNLNEFYSSICHICHHRDTNAERNALRDEMFRLEKDISD